MITQEYSEIEKWHLLDKIIIHKWLTEMLDNIKKPEYECEMCNGKTKHKFMMGSDLGTNHIICEKCGDKIAEYRRKTGYYAKVRDYMEE